jgi:hypothetical protein
MTNILKNTIHHIKQHQILYLNHKLFPYPPFENYKYTISNKNIQVKIINEETDGQEGSSISRIIQFHFPIIDKFNIIITNPYTDKIYKNCYIFVS